MRRQSRIIPRPEVDAFPKQPQAELLLPQFPHLPGLLQGWGISHSIPSSPQPLLPVLSPHQPAQPTWRKGKAQLTAAPGPPLHPFILGLGMNMMGQGREHPREPQSHQHPPKELQWGELDTGTSSHLTAGLVPLFQLFSCLQPALPQSSVTTAVAFALQLTTRSFSSFSLTREQRTEKQPFSSKHQPRRDAVCGAQPGRAPSGGPAAKGAGL